MQCQAKVPTRTRTGRQHKGSKHVVQNETIVPCEGVSSPPEYEEVLPAKPMIKPMVPPEYEVIPPVRPMKKYAPPKVPVKHVQHLK